MKQVTDTKIIIQYENPKGEITWGEFLRATMDKDILDSDIIECGPAYSHEDGETEIDGYFINVIRKVYETDEEYSFRIRKEAESKIQYQKMMIAFNERELEKQKQEHEKLVSLFNPIKPVGK